MLGHLSLPTACLESTPLVTDHHKLLNSHTPECDCCLTSLFLISVFWLLFPSLDPLVSVMALTTGKDYPQEANKPGWNNLPAGLPVRWDPEKHGNLPDHEPGDLDFQSSDSLNLPEGLVI